MCLPGDSAQLAFIHRDVAEKERQFADGGAGAGGTSGNAGDERWDDAAGTAHIW